jgi:hypothetical protein
MRIPIRFGTVYGPARYFAPYRIAQARQIEEHQVRKAGENWSKKQGKPIIFQPDAVNLRYLVYGQRDKNIVKRIFAHRQAGHHADAEELSETLLMEISSPKSPNNITNTYRHIIKELKRMRVSQKTTINH